MKKEFILPQGVDFQNLLERLRVLAWGAADILMAYARDEKPPYGFSKPLNVEDSGDGPVSAADLAVNTWLLNGFQSSFPSANWHILSEENVKDDFKKDLPFKHEWMWIIDPLDGTKDFLKGSGEYAVHLGLVHNNKPILGVVLIPECEELWFGVMGSGTWYEDRMGNKNFPSFSGRIKNNEMILVASRSHRDENLEKLIARMQFLETKAIGSIGCKICSILKGESDIYISLSGKTAPKDWDLAGPEAVLRAAGGEFTHANQQELLYNQSDFAQHGCLIATHGKVHSLLCQKILNSINSTYLI